MSETLRAGIIGMGGISERHILSYRKAEGVEVIAGADINQEAAEARAKTYGFTAYTDWRKMLDEESLDDFQQVSEFFGIDP